MPMMPIANSQNVALPANGLRALAAWAAVVIFVIPCLNRTLAQAAMIKNMTMLDKNMPDQTSIRIFFISFGSEPIREARVVLPALISSSISWEVCQKNKYGVMVVPKMAQISNIWSLEKVIWGIVEYLSTVCQSGWARTAERI